MRSRCVVVFVECMLCMHILRKLIPESRTGVEPANPNYRCRRHDVYAQAFAELCLSELFPGPFTVRS